MSAAIAQPVRVQELGHGWRLLLFATPAADQAAASATARPKRSARRSQAGGCPRPALEGRNK